MSKKIKPVAVSARKRDILSLSIGAGISLLTATEAYACLNFSNNITLFGTTDCITWSGGNFSITNTGTLSSTDVAALTAAGSASTLVNNGLLNGSGAPALENIASSLTVVNNGRIISDTLGISNNGTITSLSNNAGGSISGTTAGIQNNSEITALTNHNAISGGVGVSNAGLISTLTNTSTGSISGAITGIRNAGVITSLTNSGIISGTSYGVQSDNLSSITSFENTSTGTIEGGTAILVGNLTPSGTINVNTLTNAGRITGTTNVGVGTASNSTIGSLINTGTITGHLGGIGNAGTMSEVVNSGTISSGGYAIYNASSGTIGPITNSGLIAGAIYNGSTRNLTINGGSGSTFGILTNASGNIDSASIGSISSGMASLHFNSGNLLLNNNINVGLNTVSNTGATLQVNNQINIIGNYDQAAPATLLIGVGDSAVSNGVTADTGYGRLVVSGAATIASGSSVSLTALNSYGFAVGQRYVVVQAATNGTNYNASDLLYSASGYSGIVTGSTLVDGGTSNLLLTLESGGSSSPLIQATTPNAVSAISGLFNYTGTDASLLNVFNASAALGSTAEANRAGSQLSPAWSATVVSHASAAPTTTVLNVASSRMDDLRIAQVQGGSGVATGESGSGAALWGQAFGGKASQDQHDGISGYSTDYNGLLFGSDHQINDAWRVGGLISYANTSVDGRDDNAGSSVNVKSYGLIPYASYTADDWYLNLSGGVVQHKYDTRRLINFTGVNGVANGNYDGLQSVLSTQVGYPIRLDEQTVLTPIAGLNYSRLKQDGYTESGGAGAALSVESSKSYSLTSDLGAKLERSFDTSYGRIEPSVQLTWRHEHRDTRLRSVANYAIDTSGSTSFTTRSSAPNSDTGIMALATTLTSKDNLSVAARYSVEAASGYTLQTAELRLRYQF